MKTLLDPLPFALVSQTSHPCVFRIEARSRLFHSKLDEASRVQFVQQLRQQFPFVLLWLKGVPDEEVVDILGNSVPAFSQAVTARFFLVPATISSNKLLNNLYEGGWGMFFFLRQPQDTFQVPEFLYTKPDEIISLLNIIGAKVSIIAWYDDIEWFVAFNCD